MLLWRLSQDVGRFDPEHFGISPAEAELLDPQHRILLELAWETIENAGYRKSTLHNHRVGVFIGVEKQDYKELINKSSFELDPYSNAGNMHSMLANRISYSFNWRGPSMAVDTACSSSLAAIGQACDSLRSNRAEMALAGGINVLLTPWIFVVNRKLGMLTNEPVMRPFDQRAEASEWRRCRPHPAEKIIECNRGKRHDLWRDPRLFRSSTVVEASS